MAKSPGRPRMFDRDAALAKAAQLFWTKGFEATSISDLTKTLNIGSPSLYAAFGSKEELYEESLQHYRTTYDSFAWGNFELAATAREAARAFLVDSAAAITGQLADVPMGCMVVLSSVASEGHEKLGEIVKNARLGTLQRLKARFVKGVDDGDLSTQVDLHALARYIQTVQSGMSILARDGVSYEELKTVAEIAMGSWDQMIAASTKPAINA